MELSNGGNRLASMDAFHIRDAAVRYARAAREVAVETLWPTRCAVCDLPGELLCPNCVAELAFIDLCRACPRCGAPFGAVQCTECNPVMLASGKRSEMPLTSMASALVFNKAAGRIVSAYKDKEERRLHVPIAEIMGRYLAPAWIAGPEKPAVSFVPASAAALRRRGFDHAELLARTIAGNAGLECAGLLARPRSFDQRKLSRSGRFGNMGNSMRALDDAHVPAKLIVIDDVCTTGATLYAAADALRAAGAQTVYGLTFARVWE